MNMINAKILELYILVLVIEYCKKSYIPNTGNLL
jgi:hypothetical protein